MQINKILRLDAFLKSGIQTLYDCMINMKFLENV